MSSAQTPPGKKRFVRNPNTPPSKTPRESAPVRAELKIPTYQDNKYGEVGQPTQGMFSLLCGPYKVNGKLLTAEFKHTMEKYKGKDGKIIARFDAKIPKEDQHYMKTEISPQAVCACLASSFARRAAGAHGVLARSLTRALYCARSSS